MWWQEAWMTLQAEFSDLPDAAHVTQVCVRMGIAILLGGLIGYERELKESAAGLRTHMMVALGSALFILVPLQAGMDVEDLSRVIQGVIAGIGFLCAGAIIKHSDKEQVKGLTTAASIWATSAIGMTAGMGRETTALLCTAFALVILAVLPKIERRIEAGKASKGHPTDRV